MRLIIILLLLPFIGKTQIIKAQPNYRPFQVVATGCVDADAAAWIAASGISDTTGICNFFKGLKDSSLYSTMSTGAAYFLFAGSDAAAKLNIFNPVNSDGAYRITFFNSPTFSSGGVDWNGTNQYGNTHYTTSTLKDDNSSHISVYVRENTAVAGCDIGNTNNAGTNGIAIYARWSANQIFWNTFNSGIYTGASTTDATGFWVASRTGSSSSELWKTAVSVQTNTSAGGSGTQNITIGCDNNGFPANFSNRQIAFASIGAGLSSTQVRALNNIVEQLMDARGIGVQ